MPIAARINLLRLTASLLLVAATLSFAGKAVYMTLKAELAQVLLFAAWDKGHGDHQAVVPWPWADTHPVALLEASGRRQVVLESHSGEAMSFGPGMVSVDDSYVLAGHRDSHFSFLEQIELSDLISLTLLTGEKKNYEVVGFQTLDVRTTPKYIPAAGTLTLITCYPFHTPLAGGPYRYLVIAISVS